MFARKLLTGTLAGAMTISVVALTAGSASATYTADVDDVAPSPVLASDFVGTGSDTTQGAMAEIAKAFNVGKTTGRIINYASRATTAADPANTVPLSTGEIPRPRGSGGGLGIIHGAGSNVPLVAFARSSREISRPGSTGAEATERSDGLQMFPYAKDIVRIAVQNSGTYAPASLTGADLVKIYSCSTTNWSAFGGPNLAIKPLLPTTGSGTRDFFTGELKKANSGVDVTLGGCVDQTIQEHDPAPIVANAGSLAPFSEAKYKTVTGASTAVRLLGGFVGERAVYNVVRGADFSTAPYQAIFGPNGFICSAAGKLAIEKAGFEQLLPVSKGGVCGQSTTDPTTNLQTKTAGTQTAVTVTSASASSARIVARITSTGAPSGTVTFFEGTTVVANQVPVAQGQAVATPAAAPGTHTYRAVFTPAPNTAYDGSEGTGSGVVSKATSTSKAAFGKAKLTKKKGKLVVKPLKGSVTVTVVGSTAKASGTILVKKGSKTVGTASLSGGIAKLSLKGLKVGKNKLTATWAGDTNASGSSVSFTVKVGATKKK